MTAALHRTPVYRRPADVPATLGPCVLTIGVFDGVHRGHAHLIGHAVEAGRRRGLPTVLVTFDPHPARVLGLPRDTAGLSTIEQRAELAGRLGVDAVCVLPFSAAFASRTPEEFASGVLAGSLRAAHVVVGGNFTFGHRGAGTTATLRELGERLGFSVTVVDLLPITDRAACSSTYIRTCLRDGDLAAANRALGRPHQLEGDVAADGVFTAAHGTALPGPGTYEVLLPDGSSGILAAHSGRIRLHTNGPRPARVVLRLVRRC
ncbi:cytidyltransferase [Amycolatopsis acidicola]|uniref:FAD synthase n=1 Tax=Amycolatopsis acidicola TaxID=2596893 RepID=A0A5N0VB55_9PSEU|nr:cytidyltransferase [Amycolatopsis acidicola]KAA9163617.1 cytidyltransferase [Amycolatopsis acidicola]